MLVCVRERGRGNDRRERRREEGGKEGKAGRERGKEKEREIEAAEEERSTCNRSVGRQEDCGDQVWTKERQPARQAQRRG